MFTVLLSNKRHRYLHSELPTQHAEEKERRYCEKQGGTCSQRGGFFYILQIKCAMSPTWTSNCTVLPLGSSKLCLTSGGDELVIHHIRQLIMQLFESQENKRRVWCLWHHWLDCFINLYVTLTVSARFKKHSNVFCIPLFFSLKSSIRSRKFSTA